MPERTSISFISNRFIVLLLMGGIAFFGVSEYKQWQQRQKVQKQIAALKAEANTVEEKNAQLENSLKYLSSTGATERLAREQLGLKKEGEIPVVFVLGKAEEPEAVSSKKVHNALAWWNYFFKQ